MGKMRTIFEFARFWLPRFAQKLMPEPQGRASNTPKTHGHPKMGFSVQNEPAASVGRNSHTRDGVALRSTFHPWPIYANAGETVTCENGHPICDFVQETRTGETQDLENQLGNWRQAAPRRGDHPIPGCAICGAPFYNGLIFHIGDKWRDPYGLVRPKP